jgi:hypothetical protein
MTPKGKLLIVRGAEESLILFRKDTSTKKILLLQEPAQVQWCCQK